MSNLKFIVVTLFFAQTCYAGPANWLRGLEVTRESTKVIEAAKESVTLLEDGTRIKVLEAENVVTVTSPKGTNKSDLTIDLPKRSVDSEDLRDAEEEFRDIRVEGNHNSSEIRIYDGHMSMGEGAVLTYDRKGGLISVQSEYPAIDDYKLKDKASSYRGQRMADGGFFLSAKSNWGETGRGIIKLKPDETLQSISEITVNRNGTLFVKMRINGQEVERPINDFKVAAPSPVRGLPVADTVR